jgi:hypothetical protein
VKPAFERHDDGIRMQLRPEEVDLLRRMRDELQSVLAAEDSDDPVVQRLFPGAVNQDPDADRELRRLIHDDLLRSRLEALEELAAYLDRAHRQRGRYVTDLVDEEPTIVLGTLNDIRLALASRVGIDVLEQREFVTDRATQTTLAVMDWFGMWQEQLLVAMDPESARHYDEGHDLDDLDELDDLEGW